MNVLVVVNKKNAKACDASLLLMAYFASVNIDAEFIASHDLPDYGDNYHLSGDEERVFSGRDMAIVLGGDGTILHTARCLEDYDTPILGINFGHMGFLANSEEWGVVETVAAAMSGDVVAQKRANLHIEVFCKDDLDDFGEPVEGAAVREFFALNEIVIARGYTGRIFGFDIMVSGDKLTSMRGDGVVIATATGSTAYALSAGGPLVSSGYQGLVVVPIAPHTIRSRAVVTEPHDVVEIIIDEEVKDDGVNLFVDGLSLQFDSKVERIVVRRGNHPTTLLQYKPESFYQSISKSFF